MRIKKTRTLATLALLSAAIALPASAQDLSKFETVWSGPMTTPEHDYWRVEDITSCWAGCPVESYDFLTSLLDDPANDDKPLEELTGQANRHMRDNLASISTPRGIEIQQGSGDDNNPSIDCHDYGYLRQAINPLPMEMVRDGDILYLNYEEWNLTRTVYMDGRSFPDKIESSRLGYSIGHMEGNDLVIETRGVDNEIYNPFSGGGGHSDQLVGIERYSINDDETVLSLEITLQDPVTLKTPYVFMKQWLATPDLELLEDFCTDIPGEF